MQDTSGFLRKFKEILRQKENDLDLIVQIIKDVSGVDVSKDKVKIKNKVLRLNLPGGDKGRIFLSKQKIVQVINQKRGKHIITDLH